MCEKNPMWSGLPVWQLPVKQSNLSNIDWVHPKAKYHCFCGGISLCGKHAQDTDYFETDCESGEILSRPEIACKVCFNLWKEEYLNDG